MGSSQLANIIMSKFTSNDVVEEVVKDLLDEVVKVARRKEEPRTPVRMAVEGAARDIRSMGEGVIYYSN